MIPNEIIKIWLFPRNKNNKCRHVTNNEKKIADQLSCLKSEEYLYSRGCVRYALSDFLGISPLKIPLSAPPGKPPTLKKDFGCITFSHCRDALLVGWSSNRIGVDIERSDRIFDANAISQRFYCKEEQIQLALIKPKEYRLEALKLWVAKEASIKWQNGSIAKDISSWRISKNLEEAYHKLQNKKINILSLEYKSWYLAIAHNLKNIKIEEINEIV